LWKPWNETDKQDSYLFLAAGFAAGLVADLGVDSAGFFFLLFVHRLGCDLVADGMAPLSVLVFLVVVIMNDDRALLMRLRQKLCEKALRTRIGEYLDISDTPTNYSTNRT
jgi:hypothetical protein